MLLPDAQNCDMRPSKDIGNTILPHVLTHSLRLLVPLLRRANIIMAGLIGLSDITYIGYQAWANLIDKMEQYTASKSASYQAFNNNPWAKIGKC